MRLILCEAPTLWDKPEHKPRSPCPTLTITSPESYACNTEDAGDEALWFMLLFLSENYGFLFNILHTNKDIFFLHLTECCLWKWSGSKGSRGKKTFAANRKGSEGLHGQRENGQTGLKFRQQRLRTGREVGLYRPHQLHQPLYHYYHKHF